MIIKKVACLYRVSTTKQDYPMQKEACANCIATHSDWVLEKEYIENGVSGFKVSQEKRDVLQQVLADAKAKKFDVLLLFMFDRLGRREDETPTIVSMLISLGIEVWSSREGQQKLDEHIDSLTNYLRFWQSSGESKKTAIRVDEKHKQMTKAGEYRGGVAPYGYKNVKLGKVNFKGRDVKEPVIDDEEAEVVRLIFRLASESGYGGFKIAKHLNQSGYLTRNGVPWACAAVNYMLRNPIYKGYFTYGKTSAKKHGGRTSPNDWLIADKQNPELAIVDESLWNKVQIIRSSRTPDKYRVENMDYTQYPRSTKGELLFIGFIHCGVCGSALTTFQSTQKWTTAKDGTKKSTKPTYKCAGKGGGINCTGQHTYIKDRIEKPVLEEVYNYLDSLEQVDYSNQIDKLKKHKISAEQSKLNKINASIGKLSEDIADLKGEVVAVIRGTSKFTAEMLNDIIAAKENELDALNVQQRELKNILDEKRMEFSEIESFRSLMPSWREEFEYADTPEKKMLLSQIIRDILVSKECVEVYFKFPVEQFLS
jgi:DNA invertase Pin-like site-specific DNA recombinase